MNVLLVVIGGGIGSGARYLAQGAVHRWLGSGFPYGTIAVNIVGSFVIGVLMSSLEERFLVNPGFRLFLTVGILGGFTTFSSFSFETVTLLMEGSIRVALLNAAGSLLLCLGATWVGITLGRLV